MRNSFRCLFAAALFFTPELVQAATCFWNPLPISAVGSNGGNCQFTLTAPSGNTATTTNAGMVVGDTVNWAALTGGTWQCGGSSGAGSATILSVNGTNQVTVNSAANAGTGTTTSTLSGGRFNSTNTANWCSATASCTGNCGATGNIPKNSADTPTFDGGSGGGTIVLDSPSGAGSLSVTTLQLSNFAGTFDNSVNSNTVSVSSSIQNTSATAGRTIKMGSATYNINNTLGGIAWNFGTGANLTVTPGTSTISFNGTTALTRTFTGGGYTYANFVASSNSSLGVITITGTNTFSSLNIGSGSNLDLASTTTLGAGATSCNITGTAAQPVFFGGGALGTATTFSTPINCTATWAGISSMNLTGAGLFTATNSLNLGDNTGANLSITPPGAGGGPPQIIGG